MQGKTMRLALMILAAGLSLCGCREKAEAPPAVQPAPTAILKHATALYTSLAFYTGVQLDVFTTFDSHPMTAKDAAAALRTKPSFIERLLFARVACNLLAFSA